MIRMRAYWFCWQLNIKLRIEGNVKSFRHILLVLDDKIKYKGYGIQWCGSSLAALMSSLVSPITLISGLGLREQRATSGGVH